MAGENRTLATHVGSLVRPPELLAYIEKLKAGEPVDTDAYEATLRVAVADVVKHQQRAGIDIVSYRAKCSPPPRRGSWRSVAEAF